MRELGRSPRCCMGLLLRPLAYVRSAADMQRAMSALARSPGHRPLARPCFSSACPCFSSMRPGPRRSQVLASSSDPWSLFPAAIPDPGVPRRHTAAAIPVPKSSSSNPRSQVQQQRCQVLRALILLLLVLLGVLLLLLAMFLLLQQQQQQR